MIGAGICSQLHILKNFRVHDGMEKARLHVVLAVTLGTEAVF